MFDVLVIGAGPAGVIAALRAGDLGAKTALITQSEFGGMAATDGPIPVRTLAHAARLIKEARQLNQYGINVNDCVLDYSKLIERVRTVVGEVRTQSFFRDQINSLGVTVHEQIGAVNFNDPHTIETKNGLRLQAEKIILCTGGVSRQLSVPGFELTVTPSAAFELSKVPSSILVIGGGATGVQIASIFHAFGSEIKIFQAAPRILTTEDEDVSKSVADFFRNSGIQVFEDFGEIESFEKNVNGNVRMIFSKNGLKQNADAEVCVVAVGWLANTTDLNLKKASVVLNARGFIETNSYLQTSMPHIFAAGDITGRLMLVPQAIQDGFLAATNAVKGNVMMLKDQVNPIGGFTDPEYAQVGLTETKARESHDIIIGMVHFNSTTRTIIDGLTYGFCKLIVDRATYKILGCHVVGERAVEIVQTAAIAMTAGMQVDKLAEIPFSFPTYTAILGRAAAIVARQLNLKTKCNGYENHNLPMDDFFS